MSVKVPSAAVPFAGSGTGRRSSQTTRSLGFKGTGPPGIGRSFDVKVKTRSGANLHPRDYAKNEPKINVNYGDTINPPTDKDMWPGDDT